MATLSARTLFIQQVILRIFFYISVRSHSPVDGLDCICSGCTNNVYFLCEFVSTSEAEDVRETVWKISIIFFRFIVNIISVFRISLWWWNEATACIVHTADTFIYSIRPHIWVIRRNKKCGWTMNGRGRDKEEIRWREVILPIGTIAVRHAKATHPHWKSDLKLSIPKCALCSEAELPFFSLLLYTQ